MKTDTKQIVVLGVSFVVGLIAFAMTYMYLAAERDRLDTERAKDRAGMQLTKVVVANRDMPSGITLGAKDVAVKSVPKSGLSGDPVLPDEYEKILGRKLRFPLSAEQPILWNYVDMPNRPRNGLSPIITKGSRAISISVGGVSAVSGLVQPDDYVDVLGTFSLPSATLGETETVTMTILENVTVLAVGPRLATSAPSLHGDATGYGTVTLEVSPAEAELLVFAGYMKGKLTLSLRNPTDLGTIDKLETVDFKQLRDKIPEYRIKRIQRQKIR